MYKILIITLISLANMSSCQKLPLNNDIKNVSTSDFVLKQRNLFKKLAFCTCIYHEFPNENTISDKEASASEYFQMMSYKSDVPINKDISKFTNQWLSKTNLVSTMEVEGYKIGIMKCIEYYQSRELDSLSKKYDYAIEKKN